MMHENPWQEVNLLYNEYGPDPECAQWAVNIFLKKPIALWQIDDGPLSVLYGCAITGIADKWIRIKAFEKVETWVRKSNVLAISVMEMKYMGPTK